MKTVLQVVLLIGIMVFIIWMEPEHFHFPLGALIMILLISWAKRYFKVDESIKKNDDYNMKF